MSWDRFQDRTRCGLAAYTREHGWVWVKTARDLMRDEEVIVVVPEDGPAVYGGLMNASISSAESPLALVGAIKSLMDRTLLPCILDSEGGWSYDS